jgi:hypothetical protein
VTPFVSLVASPADTVVVDDTRRWLHRAVIGLNLCPFAKAVDVKGLVHYAVSQSTGHNDLLADLRVELNGLATLDSIVRDTTLLIAPHALADFIEFNDFLAKANRLVAKMGFEGVFQIASLHPQFQFSGTQAQDMGNYTNRSPYPTLHILREASLDRAVAAYPNANAIFEVNIQTMERLGPEGWALLNVGAHAGEEPDKTEKVDI